MKTIKLEDVSILANQGDNPILTVGGKRVLRIKDYTHRNEGLPVNLWAFYEPFMLISHLTDKPWSQCNPPTCQIPSCNLRCSYCYNPPGGKYFSHKVKIDPLVRTAFDHNKTIRISGGEPLFADPDGVRAIIEQFPPTGLVWLDTNLSVDVDWDSLIPDGTRAQIAVCGCFKGLNQGCIDEYTQLADGGQFLLKRQMQIAGKLWQSKIDYVFFYVPALLAHDMPDEAVNRLLKGFVERLRDATSIEAKFVVTPIGIHDYGSCLQKLPAARHKDFGRIRELWEENIIGPIERWLPQHVWTTRRKRADDDSILNFRLLAKSVT